MGLFSRKKAAKSTKDKNEIITDFVANEITEKENANDNIKNEMVKLGESSSRISNAIHDVNS